MELKITIDTDILTQYTSLKEDEKLGAEFIKYATDEVVVKEIIDRNLIEEVLGELSESQLEILLNSLGYIKED